MKITLWGTRGSLPSPGPETTRYGGNTSCVQIEGSDGTVLVLDAGSGIRRLGMALPHSPRRIDILLTHLHMDHIQGLGFFRPIRTPGVEAHIWGPASTTKDLRTRLSRYLSPPLFPVALRELESSLQLHEVPCGDFQIGEFTISASLVCHPDPTVGFRISTPRASLAYLPDHEPALGVRVFPLSREWTSGCDLAEGVDLLIHDGQYSDDEYQARIGWGHSSLRDSLKFAKLCEVKQLVPFHHDPSHTDDDLDRLIGATAREMNPPFKVTPGKEGFALELG
jgi:phosphoribosyl 1,2-cyclic phosphodiesterase